MSTKTPEQHKEQIKELDTRYQIILREVKNSFSYAKAYPSLSAYTDKYEKSKSSLDELNKDLFLEKDLLQSDIQLIASKISVTIKKILAVEKENAKLMLELQGLDNKKQGAIGMYNDSRYWYNFHRGENIVYFIALCILGYGVYKNTRTTI